MKVNFKGSRSYAVNLFADFLLKQFPSDEKTIIEVGDCQNFLVIKGKTSHEEPLDLLKLKTDFMEQNFDHLPEKFGTHTIDLIDYSQKMESPKFLKQDFFCSENPLYTKYQIKRIKFGSGLSERTPMIECSEFPYGHSLSMGRTLFYYSLHLAYSVPSDFIYDHLNIVLCENHSEEFFNVFVDREQSEKLQSFFMDYFDFNYKNFEKKIEGHKFESELNDPLTLPSFITTKPENLIMI
jgi:hypothetical protein